LTERARLPVVTLILIAANMVAAFALVRQPDLAYDLGFRIDHPSFQGAVTSLFLHQNLVHLLGNMVFLAAVGAAVELSTGSFRFITVYMVSGLVGVAAHWAFAARVEDPAPLLGASGAIAGCAGYYTVRYLRLRVPLAPKFGASILAVTLFWLALQIVGAFFRLGDPTGGVAFWSHLGGFLAGFVMSVAFRTPDLNQLKLGHAVLEEMNARSPAAAVTAARKHLETHPNDTHALRELASALDKLGDHDDESRVLIQLFNLSPSVETLRRLVELHRLALIPTLERLKLAEKYVDDHDVARELLQSVVEGDDDIQRPEAMLALAGLERGDSEERATEILIKLREKYPLHPTVELARARGWLA
jgi:membrane associated rhomboid family serine protease